LKVNEYVLRRVNRNVRDFVDEATIIFNYGKYSAQTLTQPPNWVARNGEFAFFSSSTTSGNRVYFYANNQWNWLAGGANGALAAGLDTQVQVNSMGYFYADSGFRYIAHTAVGITQNMGYVLDTNSSSGTYMTFNSSSQFLEFYVGSEVRLQM